MEARPARAAQPGTAPDQRVVDIGNILSLRHQVPTGGTPLTCWSRISNCGWLRGKKRSNLSIRKRSNTLFLGGRVCRRDAVLTRRWTWRQSDRTLTLPSTTAIEYT